MASPHLPADLARTQDLTDYRLAERFPPALQIRAATPQTRRAERRIRKAFEQQRWTHLGTPQNKGPLNEAAAYLVGRDFCPIPQTRLTTFNGWSGSFQAFVEPLIPLVGAGFLLDDFRQRKNWRDQLHRIYGFYGRVGQADESELFFTTDADDRWAIQALDHDKTFPDALIEFGVSTLNLRFDRDEHSCADIMALLQLPFAAETRSELLAQSWQGHAARLVRHLGHRLDESKLREFQLRVITQRRAIAAGLSCLQCLQLGGKPLETIYNKSWAAFEKNNDGPGGRPLRAWRAFVNRFFMPRLDGHLQAFLERLADVPKSRLGSYDRRFAAIFAEALKQGMAGARKHHSGISQRFWEELGSAHIGFGSNNLCLGEGLTPGQKHRLVKGLATVGRERNGGARALLGLSEMLTSSVLTALAQAHRNTASPLALPNGERALSRAVPDGDRLRFEVDHRDNGFILRIHFRRIIHTLEGVHSGRILLAEGTVSRFEFFATAGFLPQKRNRAEAASRASARIPVLFSTPAGVLRLLMTEINSMPMDFFQSPVEAGLGTAHTQLANYRGQKVAIKPDASSLLADAAEEMSFNLSKTVEKEISKRNGKTRAGRKTNAMEQVALYLKQLPDLGKPEKLTRFLKHLKSMGRLTPKQFQREARSFFEDLSHQYAALALTRDVLQAEQGAPESITALTEALTQMEREHGPSIRTETRSGRALISPTGPIHAPACDPLEDCLTRLIREGNLHLTLDLAKVDLITSAGLRVILQATMALGKQGELVLRNLQPQVEEVVLLVGLQQLTKRETEPPTQRGTGTPPHAPRPAPAF